MQPQDLQDLRALIESEFLKQGAELVDLHVRRGGNRTVFTITADKPGGITLDDCAALNRYLGDLFERLPGSPEDTGFGRYFAETPYLLEVSSPGLDRPLVTEKDFKKAVGDWVRFVHKDGTGRVIVTVGKVVLADAAAVGVEIVEGAQPVSIALSAINRAAREIRLKK